MSCAVAFAAQRQMLAGMKAIILGKLRRHRERDRHRVRRLAPHVGDFQCVECDGHQRSLICT